MNTFKELKDFFNTCNHNYIGILYKTPNYNFSIEILNKHSKNDWINYIEDEIRKYLNIYDFWCFYSLDNRTDYTIDQLKEILGYDITDDLTDILNENLKEFKFIK